MTDSEDGLPTDVTEEQLAAELAQYDEALRAAEVPPAHVIPLYRRIDWISFGLTALLVFLGYWWTLAPDLTLEDCGELAVASQYAGVPHPPGYPVWAIYSWLFTLLPISNIAYRVGRTLQFDAASYSVKGDAEANRLFRREYRKPFVVPEKV